MRVTHKRTRDTCNSTGAPHTPLHIQLHLHIHAYTHVGTYTQQIRRTSTRTHHTHLKACIHISRHGPDSEITRLLRRVAGCEKRGHVITKVQNYRRMHKLGLTCTRMGICTRYSLPLCSVLSKRTWGRSEKLNQIQSLLPTWTGGWECTSIVLNRW